MKKIKTVKTTTTLYLDYEYEAWDEVSPKNNNPYYRLYQDYTILRKGAILNVYLMDEDDKENEKTNDKVFCVSRKRYKRLSFSSLEAMRRTGWFEEIKK